jgi:3-hydroxymyristoyl/3-hydroxydecanoyl-(acyl carrier protein) dehydratase
MLPAHFRAFSFVDRITSLQHGTRIRGAYRIPPAIREFPLALAGEAVGQLAAWAAMAATDFRQRPLAGLAGAIELQQEVRPGQVLELAADLEHVDDQSAQYSGMATVDGAPVVRLTDCVGPMMPVVEFDDPEALRTRFDQLQQQGADGEGFPGLPGLRAQRTGGETGQHVSASFQVPAEAPLFGDHFPRRAVFPGSLLMQVSLQVAACLAVEMAPPAQGKWILAAIKNMKLRSFIPPGTVLQLQTKLKQRTDATANLAVETRSGNEVIATTGVLLKPGGWV